MAIFWFEQDREKLATVVFDTVNAIRQDQNSMRESWLRFTSLYRDRDVMGFDPREWNNTRLASLLDDAVTWNVVRAVVDTLVAKITLERPSIAIQTINAPEILQSQARLLQQYAVGTLKAVDAWEHADLSLKHSALYSIGHVKVWTGEGRPMATAVHPDRVTIDDVGDLDSEPHSRFQTAFMSQRRLLELFPKAKQTIIESNVESVSSSSGTAFRDVIEVKEAWRLPSGKTPGRHSIVTNQGVLFDEKYERKDFPFADIRFGKDVQGWYGIGLVEQIEGVQVEINRTLDKIRGNLEHIANTFIFKHTNSQISDADLADNEFYKIIEGLTPPQIITPPAIHPQVIEYLNLQWQRAFELSGISQLNATSSNPALPRLDSASALRFFQGIQTERFSEVAKAYNKMIERISRLLIKAGKELGSKWRVKGVARDFIRMIEWDDISMDEDQFHLDVSTISSLPHHPAGRRAEVKELAQGGLLSREEALQLMDLPDLPKYYRLTNASIEDLEHTFEHMLEKNEFIEPLPFQDLQTGIKLGTSYWLRARMDGADEERLALVARWLQEASELLTPTPDEPTIAAAPNPLEGLPADPAAAQQLSQAAATLPGNGQGQIPPI